MELFLSTSTFHFDFGAALAERTASTAMDGRRIDRREVFIDTMLDHPICNVSSDSCGAIAGRLLGSSCAANQGINNLSILGRETVPVLAEGILHHLPRGAALQHGESLNQ
jgi:hypothetical protein